MSLAQEIYGRNEYGPMSLVPRSRFNYTVRMEINPPANDFGLSSSIIQFDRTQAAQLPGFNSTSQVLNQYNQRRVVNTKLEYDPCMIVFYDTSDNAFDRIIRTFFKNYFNENGIEFDQNITAPNQVTSDEFESSMGYKLTSESQRYFFKSIDIIQFGNRVEGRLHARETKLVNPSLAQLQHDNLSYSDSQPVIYTATFMPERVVTRDVIVSED